MSYQPLPMGEKAVFDINASSPSFAFSTGKSFFKAFELPKQNKPTRIKLRTYLVGDRIDRAFVFYPSILMLDDNFRVVADIEPPLSTRRASFEETAAENNWGLPFRLEGEFPVKPQYRYLIVRTTARQLEQSSPYLHVARGPAALLGLDPQGLHKFEHLPYGRVVLEPL
jgi:maltose operon protein